MIERRDRSLEHESRSCPQQRSTDPRLCAGGLAGRNGGLDMGAAARVERLQRRPARRPRPGFPVHARIHLLFDALDRDIAAQLLGALSLRYAHQTPARFACR
jgi:hypothetical protein